MVRMKNVVNVKRIGDIEYLVVKGIKVNQIGNYF